MLSPVLAWCFDTKIEKGNVYMSLGKGLRIHWKGEKELKLEKLGYSYVDQPELSIYFQNGKKIIKIRGDRMKIDHLHSDFIFDGNVVMITGAQQLKLPFLYFNPSALEIRAPQVFTSLKQP